MIDINKVIALCEKLNLDIQVYSDYAEPGYTIDKDKYIFLANWNNFPKNLSHALELNGELEWSDEWMSCSDCNKLVRTQPNSYGWKQSFWLNECEIICRQCLDEEEYIRYLLNNPDHVNVFDDLDLSKHGFENLNGEFESGLYGISDKPKDILKAFMAKHPQKEFVFSGLGQEQFRLTFEIWGRDKTIDN